MIDLKKPFSLRIYLLILFACATINFTKAQNDTLTVRKAPHHSFGVLPAIAYDSDLGFQYGVLTNIYWHGQPSVYPEYEHSLYLEASKFTAGSSLLRLYYDSERLFKPVRTVIDVTSIRDQMMDFYGFNGYQSIYHHSWEEVNSPDYITRAFYRFDRKKFRVMANFSGPVIPGNDKLSWVGGITAFHFSIHSVDLEHLNKKADPPLPEVDGLYEKYINWGIISQEEKNGGTSAYLKLVLGYDSRDFESNPSKGIYSEVLLSSTPAFLSSLHTSYSMVTVVHRQFITVFKNKSIFAYRLLYQNKLSGNVPFYMAPHIVSSTLGGATSQGLGGGKTLRGINRNRVVGDGILLGNIEWRQMINRFQWFKQDFYLAINAFADAGMVVNDYNLDLSKVPDEDKPLYFSSRKEAPHVSSGLGLKIAMNENFIVSADFGLALDKQDGDNGIYINLNYLF